MGKPALADTLFDPWCSNQDFKANRKLFRLLTEKAASQGAAVDRLRSLLPTHYSDPKTIQRQLKKWGYDKTLNVLRSKLPEGKKARSGDIGEVLATEYVNRKLDFQVPIFKLRWRDDREMAMRGDDIFAIHVNEEGEVSFLKGEVKSRQSLGADAIQEAAEALRRHGGRPAPHTINFVVDRLSQLNQDELYEALEDYLTPDAVPPKRVTHLVFVLSGNNPQTQLQSFVTSHKGTIEVVAIGLRVKNHAEFIRLVFEGVKLA